MQCRFKRGVYSHETALFLWDLTDRTPNRYHMTFPVNYNVTKPKEENIRCLQCKGEWYELGFAEVTTLGGNIVKAYNAERTLCDILRTHSSVDIQIVTEAFKCYISKTDINIPALSEYAKILKVEENLGHIWRYCYEKCDAVEINYQKSCKGKHISVQLVR